LEIKELHSLIKKCFYCLRTRLIPDPTTFDSNA